VGLRTLLSQIERVQAQSPGGGAEGGRGAPLLRYMGALGLFVLAWHIASGYVGKPNTLPAPASVFQQFIVLYQSGGLYTDIGATLGRLLAGYLLGAVVGIPLGFAMGMSRTTEELLSPVVEMLRPISGIAWLPLGLFIFGVGNELPLFIIFYGSLFPFVLNTVGAVHQVDHRLVDVARTLGAGRWTIVLRVVLPAALPMILVGARLGLGVGWMAVIASELVGAPSGLGYMIEWNRTMLMSNRVLVGVFTIGVLGYLMDWGLRRLSLLLTPWWGGWRTRE
jgi:ABC-type nitrate/sulfonate/bicarbonate transport system permease component